MKAEDTHHTGRRGYGDDLRGALSQLAATYRGDRLSRVVIACLLIANFLFIVIDFAVRALILPRARAGVAGYAEYEMLARDFLINIDRSYPEFLNYLQAGACAALLLAMALLREQRVYAAWSLVFLFVLLDDSLSIHEGLGRQLVATLELPALPGLRPQDSGELLTWAALGAFLLGVLVWGFRSASREATRHGILFAAIFAVLLLFAVVFDMIHEALGAWSGVVNYLLIVIEDGGEMFTVAAACSAALLLYRRETARL